MNNINSKKKQSEKFIFSFVMPVYNVEAYLEETIESILSQTLDFESNCQLIFINDGSPDNSEETCLKYKKQFPNNIIYIKQKNRGVSAARNAGVKRAEGKYISFLDSDDALSSDTLGKVHEFFEKHQDEIDVVSIKLEFFGAKTGPHMLNHKYSSTRVINIIEEYDSIQLSGGSSFVKTEAIKNKHFFDVRLVVSEDATFLTEVILEKMAYGVVHEPTYFYRKRVNRDSAIGSSFANKSWYFDTPNYGYKHLFGYAMDKLGFIPKYVQYLVMYDLCWRYMQTSQSVLDPSELIEYKNNLASLLECIDDSVIIQQKEIQADLKLYILKAKYGNQYDNAMIRFNHKFYIRGNKFYDYDWNLKFFIELSCIKNKKLTIEGRPWTLLMPGVEFGFMSSGKFYLAEKVRRVQLDQTFLGESIMEGVGFRATIPISNNTDIKAALRFSDGSVRTLNLVAGSKSGLQDFHGKPYRAEENYLICQPDNKTIVIQKKTKVNWLKKEIRYLQSYLKVGKYTRKVNDSNNKNFFYSPITFRIIYYLTKPFFNGEIWIISDRYDAAGDNGEALFCYMSKIKTGVGVYFAVSKSSSDYDRLRNVGKVIDRESWFYKLIFLHSNKIISSHADDYVINPFGYNQAFLRDLFNFDFVFLQHGIIMNDLSKWLNRYNKNIRLFITSSRKEYASILGSKYHYKSHQVALTGLPRYDLLSNEPEKVIIVAPTWRWQLSSGLDKNNKRSYSPEFIKSDYFAFYNQLLNDKNIQQALEKYDTKIEFYLHPALSMQTSDFSSNKYVSIMKPPYNYRDAFKRGCMLLTDYSSVGFDFGYLKKPILYTHFDKDTFFEGQIYTKGYFSYEKDGFGPVLYDYGATVKSIIKLLENGCIMNEKYTARVDSFFAYKDKDNSNRVYEAIKALDVRETEEVDNA